MRTLGIKKVWDMSNRLYLASWPLLDDQGHADPDGARVLDLTRAAAVRNAAIEVLQPGADGRRMRRTYVGKFAEALPDLFSVCGSVFTDAKYSALIFGEPRQDGQRRLTIYNRKTRPQTHELVNVSLNCTPAGNLNFIDLREGASTIAWANVAQVLFRWKQAS